LASEAVHRAEAIANRDIAEWILATRPNDRVALRWAVTATFYSALHAMSAHLVARGIVATRHEDRDREMASPAAGVPSDVYDAYQYLKRRSIGACYNARLFSAGEVRYLIDSPLATILAFVGI
jgi:hypothetical protein